MTPIGERFASPLSANIHNARFASVLQWRSTMQYRLARAARGWIARIFGRSAARVMTRSPRTTEKPAEMSQKRHFLQGLQTTFNGRRARIRLDSADDIAFREVAS
jgi:hypothetical protein